MQKQFSVDRVFWERFLTCNLFVEFPFHIILYFRVIFLLIFWVWFLYRHLTYVCVCVFASVPSTSYIRISRFRLPPFHMCLFLFDLIHSEHFILPFSLHGFVVKCIIFVFSLLVRTNIHIMVTVRGAKEKKIIFFFQIETNNKCHATTAIIIIMYCWRFICFNFRIRPIHFSRFRSLSFALFFAFGRPSLLQISPSFLLFLFVHFFLPL